MGGRLTISTQNDQVARDLADKLLLFPRLPWILVNRVGLDVRAKGRAQAFSGSGQDTLGSAKPWPGSRMRYAGAARDMSFVYSTKQSRKNALANIGHPLANIWETTPGKRVVKRRIPFLSVFMSKYRRSGAVESIVAEALENIAKDGAP
jgi:hypothetical protein